MKTDIEIANQAKIDDIRTIAKKIHLNEDDIETFGHDKAKIKLSTITKNQDKKPGKLILVTAINPTASGEGKTTVSIGLADAFQQLNENIVLTLREPSLGPVMGIKGGATGGGYSQVIPMADINLHFTGDLHAITVANNTISAILDNYIQQGNELNIDTRKVQWKRVLDLNDRELREIVVGLGGEKNGVPREDGFDITVASEIMAVLCLSKSLMDLKENLSKIVVAYDVNNHPITVHDLQIEGMLTVLLKDAIKPNLVQTLEHTPTLIHGGPFANIAHGCNSIMATNAALHMADYVITEAGFGSDLGGEKFLDIVSPKLDSDPNAIVIVATVKALKLNANIPVDQLKVPNVQAVKEGFKNLQKHIQNMKQYDIPVVVAINRFESDSEGEIQAIMDLCETCDSTAIPVDVWKDGGKGAIDLAHHLINTLKEDHDFHPLYNDQYIMDTLHQLATTIYGGRDVILSNQAKQDLKLIEENHWDHLPICVAKTPVSLSDDPTKLGAPSNFDLHIRALIPKIGAGFIVAIAGNIMTMPGLPKHPIALDIDIDKDGNITGLF